ncbi:MAG: hypothetical protein RL077_1820, partial [Verrucomicrobiota bacterium]
PAPRIGRLGRDNDLGRERDGPDPPAACGLTNASVRTSLANVQTLIFGGVVSG